jgi:hypothetical protein
MSAAEREPPGWFSLCTASASRGNAGIDLLAAGASRGYLDLGGGSCPGGLQAGIRFRFAGSLARIRAGYLMNVCPPGFVPGPFLASEEDLVLTLERRWPARGGAWAAGLSASNRIETSPDGTVSDDPSGTVSAGWDSRRFQAAVTADVDRDDGAAVEFSAGVPEVAGTEGAGGKVRCAWSGGEGISLAVSAHARFSWGCGEILLRAGVRGVRPDAGDGGESWGSVEWRVTDRLASPREVRAP